MISRLKGERGWQDKVRQKARWVWEEEQRDEGEARKKDEL